MGIYYTSYAILGVLITPKNLQEEKKIPRCVHAVPEGSKFCPECGEIVGFRSESKLTETGKALFDYVYEDREMPDDRFQLIRYFEEDQFFFGFAVSSDRDGYKVSKDIPSQDEIIAGASELLEPLGLWTEEVEQSYGLYSVTTGS